MRKMSKSLLVFIMIGLMSISGLESMPVLASSESTVTITLDGVSDQAVTAVLLITDESGTVSRKTASLVNQSLQLTLPGGVYDMSVITLDDQFSIQDTGRLQDVEVQDDSEILLEVTPLNVTVVSEIPDHVLVGQTIEIIYQITDRVGFISSGTSSAALGSSTTPATIESVEGNKVTLKAMLKVQSESSTSLTLSVSNTAWADVNTPLIRHTLTLESHSPVAPTLTSTAQTYNSILLAWVALPMADRYEVWRSEGNASFIKIKDTTDTVFSDVSLKYQVSYRYKVVVVYTVDGTSVAKESNIVSVATALEIPVLSVVNKDHLTNTLSWSAVNGATGYEVSAAKGSGSFAVISTLTLTNFTHAKLTLNTTYSYRVRAYRLVGKLKTYGAYTEIVKVLTLPAVTPSVSAVTAGISKLSVSWTAVSGASGYEVYASTAVDKGYVLYATVTKNTAILSGLTINVPVYIKVRTYILSGKTKVYSKSESTPISATPIPLSPTLKTASISYNTLQLSWGAIENASGYLVEQYNAADSTYNVIAETSSSQLTFNVSELKTGSTYTFRVRAFTDVSSGRVYGDYSTAVAGIPKLSTPTGLTAVSSQYNTLSISWASVDGAQEYYLYRSTSSKFTSETMVYSGDQMSYIDTGLVTNTVYYYRLMAMINGESSIIFSGYSAVVTAKPIPAASIVSAVSVDHTSTQLTWDAVDGATGYDVYASTSLNGSYKLIKSQTTNSFLHTKLALGSTTYYKVIAYRTIGKTKVSGTPSSIVSIRAVPAPVKNLVGASQSASSVIISWSAIQGAVGYRVYVDASSSGTYVNVGGKVTTTSTTITGLTINKEIAVKVYALMMNGKTEVLGTISSTIIVKPVPQSPTVNARAVDHQTIELSWPAIPDVNGYAVYIWDPESSSFVWLKDVVSTVEIISELPAGKSQTFLVIAYQMVNESRVDGTASAQVSITPRLQAPVFTNFGAANFETISMAFNAVLSATHYRIYRGLSSTSLTLFESWEADVLCTETGECTYIDASVMTGTPTYYQVQACVTEDEIEYCGDVSEIRTATTVLEAPIDPWTYKNTTTSLVINYGLSQGADGYEFYYATSSNGKYSLIYTMYGSNGLEHTGLKSNTTYYYKIRAFREVNGKKVYSALTPIFSGRTAKTLKVAAELTFVGNYLVGIEISNKSSDTLRIMRYGWYNDYYYDYDDCLIDLRSSYYDLWGGYYVSLTFYYTYTPLYVLVADNFMLNLVYDDISYYLFLYGDGRVVLYEDENYYYGD